MDYREYAEQAISNASKTNKGFDPATFSSALVGAISEAIKAVVEEERMACLAIAKVVGQSFTENNQPDYAVGAARVAFELAKRLERMEE